MHAELTPEQYVLDGTDRFPNSALPALVYRGAFAGDDLAAGIERRFAENGWTDAWRNGLYTRHHYHSTAHEVLGVYRGAVHARLGGPAGPLVKLATGDVAILPAGVAHMNEWQSDDFRVVGAYPTGTRADLCWGDAAERPQSDANVAAVPRPARDPVLGVHGGLVQLWPSGDCRRDELPGTSRGKRSHRR